MIHRSIFLSGAVLILLSSQAAVADGDHKNFGASRFEIVTIEPAAGDVEEAAPAVQPLADGTKEQEHSVVAAVPMPSAASDVCAAGLAEPSDRTLSVFHVLSAAAIVGADKEINVNNLSGVLVYEGGTYTLRLVTLEAQEFVPFSGVSFPMRIRFDYADAKEEHVSVDVPVRIGAANLGMEKILAVKGVMPLSGDDLMPPGRAYATMTDCTLVGLPIKRVVMTTPLEVSEEQLARFSRI